MKNKTTKIISELFRRFPELDYCTDSIFEAVKAVIECYARDNKLLICGNGGSASDSQHMVGELMKSFVLPRKLPEYKQEEIRKIYPVSAEYLIENLQIALPAISLVGETALSTAYANDAAADLCFAQQVLGYGKQGDILIAISTSGNSKNVVYASQIAKLQGILIIALTGKHGGKINDIADISINVPSNETYKIQEYHLPIYHALCMAVENEFFGRE